MTRADAAQDPSLVAVVGTTLPSDLTIERELLREAGAEVADGRDLQPREAAQLLSAATGILSEGFFDFDFSAMPRCRALSLYSIGFDQIDLPAATDAGIAVTNVPEYCIDDVADHALALLLATWRKLRVAGDIAASDDWAVHSLTPIHRLAGSTLGLIGFGAIARAVARRAAAFGLRLVAYDAYVEPQAGEALGVELLPLPEVLVESDAISIHVPLTEETAGLLGEAELGLLRDGAVIVGTSRGGVVQEEALLAALDSGRLGGAGLDVLATEPPASPSSRRLATHQRVVCTPHMGYYSEQALADLRRGAAGSLAAILSGGRPSTLLNPAVLERRGPL